ncbi:hypothetical protein [Chromohalobacter israelensis]|uniref:hypothetical protein n=1 Tax=Chromohalobacter israelensis TaxID=141390 RepID=UPI001CC4C611|nr:hypothetical protein [Chromohalobacter salexigens]MBZ5875994.1 hypothetical protein [Chromohalobacter salexigens]
MALEKATLTFYNVDYCGLYKWGEHTPFLGDSVDVLDDLLSWSSGKGVAQTATYQVPKGNDLLPSLLLDIKKSGNNYLLTLWNQTPNQKGAVPSVDPNSSVGSANITMNGTKKGTIPGFATYFWFVPSEGVFACVQFDHSTTGHKVMERYVKSFIDPFSKHVVFNLSPDGSFESKGYAGHLSDNHLKLHPKFSSTLFRKQGNVDHILDNYANIEQVIRKTNLEMKNTADKQLLQKMMDAFRRGVHISSKLPASGVNVNYQMPIELTRSELGMLIKDWETNNYNSKVQWDDYGFKLKGEMNRIYWLSGSIARDAFDLDVVRQNDEVVDPDSLIQELNKKSQYILRLIK